MNYIGSKFKLSVWIKEQITEVVGELSDKVFCDLFAGTGIMGRAFKPVVNGVISNDMEYYSFVLNKYYIENRRHIPDQEGYIDALERLPLGDGGFIYQHYCLGSGSGRQYFSDENGQKIDVIRVEIEQWREQKVISDNVYYFLLASLLESADKVANTASVYGSFLKSLKASAKAPLRLQPAPLTHSANGQYQIYQQDSNALIKSIAGDILYLDPPYNSRQYGANYHLLNTIALYDEFIPRGKTGLRAYNRSDYCQRASVAVAFDELIKHANFTYIFLSYNNEGLMSVEQIKQIMGRYGTYHLQTKEYQRFRADKIGSRNHKADKTVEYLHILVKKEVKFT